MIGQIRDPPLFQLQQPNKKKSQKKASCQKKNPKYVPSLAISLLPNIASTPTLCVSNTVLSIIQSFVNLQVQQISISLVLPEDDTLHSHPTAEKEL